MAKPRINFAAMRHLPATPQEAESTPLASLGLEALHEALAMGADDKARRATARGIALVGRKYTQEARDLAACIGDGSRPLPPIPPYMLKG